MTAIDPLLPLVTVGFATVGSRTVGILKLCPRNIV
jgi:hypothetical protein